MGFVHSATKVFEQVLKCQGKLPDIFLTVLPLTVCLEEGDLAAHMFINTHIHTHTLKWMKNSLRT